MPVNYTLLTTVPPSYLVPCSTVIPRPVWEPYLYYMSLPSMCILLVFIVVMVIIEAEHNLKEALLGINRLNQTIQPTLDLRLIGAQTRRDLHMQKPESEEKSKKDDESPLLELANQEVERYSAVVPATGKSKKKCKKACDPNLEVEPSEDLKNKIGCKKEGRKNLLLPDKPLTNGIDVLPFMEKKQLSPVDKFGMYQV